MAEITPIYGKCEWCGKVIIAKADKNKQGRYKKYCSMTCKNKQNKIDCAAGLQQQKVIAPPSEVKQDVCVDCKERPPVVHVGTKGFCLICVNKE